MIVDASAIVAILLGEPGAERLVEAIAAAARRTIGAPTVVEASAVMLARKGPAGEVALDALLARLDIETVAMSPAASNAARSAYRRFGKGVGSPAVLNFGDCLAYGVAAAADAPLLFTGDDFGRTDIRAARS
ncbi:MAG: type II toxin-antitoxin system VapC family toxin [Gemmatimonadaceae bacterium]|nr:type II toxin-antitoxin system VapC family toxin [Gemmatimonadaceae bacterium]